MRKTNSTDNALLPMSDKAATRQWQDEMLAQLNAVYADGPTPEEKRLLKAMKARLQETLASTPYAT